MTGHLTLTLDRLPTSNSYATYGRIVDANDTEWCVTLELPWKNNAPDESCIPAGMYVARRFKSPKRGYDVFLLEGVPDREAIELHIGNLVHETHGCILLGSNFGTVNGQAGVTGSQAAFARFMDALRGVYGFTLVIRDHQPLKAIA